MPAPTLPSENPAVMVASPSGYAIEFDNVSIAFDEKVVLDGISFQLPHGETKALFGVAGSGKSVLLKLAIGLLRPDSGHIFVLGEEVTHMPEQELFALRRRVGMVFQESALFDSLKVSENVAFRLMEEKSLRGRKSSGGSARCCALWSWNEPTTCFHPNCRAACGGA